MNLQEFFEYILFRIDAFELTVAKLLLTLGVIGFCLWIWRWSHRSMLPNMVKTRQLDGEKKSKLYLNTRISIFLVFLLFSLIALGLDITLFEYKEIQFKASWFLLALLLLQAGHLLDIYLINVEEGKRTGPSRSTRDIAADSVTQQVISSRKNISRTIYWIVLSLLAFLVIDKLNLDRTLFTLKDESVFTVSNIVSIVFILLLTHLIVWIFIHLFLARYYKVRQIDHSSQYAFNQLVRYTGYVIGLYVAIASTGVEMTLILGGAAALLVGVGLGLQQTFNDLFSGILLLSERRIEVGDFVEVEGLVGAVKEIGLRASVLETWDKITVIIPNSKLVSINVVNWSHFTEYARFNVEVGVAYGSDTQLVKEILLRAARKHDEIHEYPEPMVIFDGFGNSSLNFKIHFWTDHFKTVQRIKSDLRFMIDSGFREAGVVIPFPQRDLWFRNQPPKADS